MTARKTNSRGNIFTMLLGMVAVVGALSYASYQLMSGPLSTMARASKKANADADMQSVARIIIMSAVDQSNNGDCDSDGSVEPPQWRATAGNKPVGAGLVPSDIGAPVTDPWGSSYGYCVWDVGSAIDNAGCGGVGQSRLSGSPAPLAGASQSQTVVAVISSGSDRQFQTTCSDYVDANTDVIASTGDDIILRYSYSEAAAATATLWTLKVGAPTTAAIVKNLEIGDSATRGAVTALSLDTVGKVIANGGLQLEEDTVVTACNASSKGLMRYDTASSKVQYCDGAAWGNVTGGSNIDDMSDGVYDANGHLYLGDDAGASFTVGNDGNTGVGIGALSSGNSASYSTAFGALALNDGDADANTAFGFHALMGVTSGRMNVGLGREAIGGAGLNAAIGNTAAGDSAGYGLNGSSHNVAVGASTLSLSAGGEGNIAVGYGAMMQTGGGSYNIAIGSSAYSSPSGNFNVGIGYDSLGKQDTGEYNIGIGTSALNNNSANSQNIAIGYQALRDISGLDYNLAVGANALYANSASDINTAFGALALEKNTTGIWNDAFGYAALKDNVGGDQNAAFGYEALTLNGNTFQNVAFGASALSGLDAGEGNTAFGYQAIANFAECCGGNASYNTAFGRSALANTDRGSRSVAIGYMALFNSGSNDSDDTIAVGTQALSSDSSAGPNIAIGYNAMNGVQAGVNNIAIGTSALSDNAAGSANIAIGYYALLHGGGSANVAVGYQALMENTTGEDNVAVGYEALKTASGVRGAVAIGYQALVNAASGDRMMAIGYRALATIGRCTDNLAIGYNAMLKSEDTAENNTAVGYNALYNGTRVSRNVAVGYDVLYNNVAGNDNVAIGAEAAQATNSDSNVAVGGYAMSDNISGMYNVAIGTKAASTGDGRYYVAIGHTAMFSAAADSNAIGSEALLQAGGVSGNDAFGYQALHGPSADGNVGVGVRAFASVSVAAANTGIGSRAGDNVRTGSKNVAIGSQAGPRGDFSNTISIGYNAQASASNKARIGNGSVTTIAGQVAWTATSDGRIKKDIRDSDLGLDFINHLHPVSYRRIDGNGRLDYGFVAQEVQEALGSRVTNMVVQENDAIKSFQLRATDIIAPLVKSIQQLSVMGQQHDEAAPGRARALESLEKITAHLFKVMLLVFFMGFYLGVRPSRAF